MADNKEKRGPQDGSRVNVNEEYEVAYWSKHFGVSADQLRAAVEKAGTSAKAVQEELSRS